MYRIYIKNKGFVSDGFFQMWKNPYKVLCSYDNAKTYSSRKRAIGALKRIKALNVFGKRVEIVSEQN